MPATPPEVHVVDDPLVVLLFVALFAAAIVLALVFALPRFSRTPSGSADAETAGRAPWSTNPVDGRHADAGGGRAEP